MITGRCASGEHPVYLRCTQRSAPRNRRGLKPPNIRMDRGLAHEYRGFLFPPGHRARATQDEAPSRVPAALWPAGVKARDTRAAQGAGSTVPRETVA
jgi:hypothetical protein